MVRGVVNNVMRGRRAGAWSALVACGVLLAGCSSGDEGQDAAGSQWDLEAAPEEVTWSSSVGCLVLPVSKVSGPAHQDEGVPGGFEHSPQGAVMASVVGQGWLAAAGDEVWPEVATHMVSPGPGRDQWAQARSLMSVEGCLEDPPQFVGFSFESFDEQRASLALAVRRPDGVMYAMPVQLVWQSEDWKLVLPTQDEAVDAVELSSLDGFVAFEQEGR